jgi:RHS repeat-associated protein
MRRFGVGSIRAGFGILLASAIVAGLQPAQAVAAPKPTPAATALATPRQATGTAAGRSHQVTADKTAATRGSKGAPPSRAKRPKGAVPVATVHGPTLRRVPSGSNVHAAPAKSADPARKVKGFNARTSLRRSDLSSATTTVFQNVDGTFTAQIHQTAVNKRAADGTWVADAAATAAITNPTGTRTTSDSTYVKSGVTQNFSDDNALYVGRQNGYNYNSFLKFDGFAGQFTNVYVLSAKLYLDTEYSGDDSSNSCSSEPVSVAPVTSSWSAGTLKTYPGPSTGASIGTASWAGGVNCSQGRVWGAVPLSPRTLTNWTHGWAANNGLAITAPYADAAWKEFNPDDAYLSIEYAADGAGASYAETLYASPWNNKTGWAKVTVQNEGSATWTSSNGYKLGYEIYTVSGTTRTLYSTSNYLTTMPSGVAPNKSVTVTATLPALTPGSTFLVCWDMVYGSQYFSGLGIPQSCYNLAVVNNPPIMDSLYPYNNSTQYTLTPNLYMTAHDVDAYPNTGLKYTFNLYAAGSTTVLATSGSTTSANWIVPSGKLSWGSTYYWTAQVTDNVTPSAWSEPAYFSIPSPAQPLVTSHLGAADEDATLSGVNPAAGNYSTETVDFSIPGASRGPQVELRRTYNSMDPRNTGYFGAGWSSLLDSEIVDDSDGSGSLVVQLPDGREERFGLNADGSYKAPPGSREILTISSGYYVLKEPSGLNYRFYQGGTDPISGRTVHLLSDVNDDDSHYLRIFYQNVAVPQPDGSTATVVLPVEATTDPTNLGAGSVLSPLVMEFQWGSSIVTTTSGETVAVPHVTSASLYQVNVGKTRTWTYKYDGANFLTSVCPPTSATACTTYTYNSGSATGSHFASMVLDSGAQAYWRLADAAGATRATDQVAVNVGTFDGTPANVSFGQAGALAGSPATSASFNGTSSKISLPNNLVAGSNMAVGMWFKTTQPGGTLFSYQSAPAGTAVTANYVPALYVGSDGKLHAQFWSGALKPMASPSTVNDGKWHFVVLSGAASTQTLYLDGNQVATVTGGTIAASAEPYVTLGAGQLGGSWPSVPSANPLGWFSGQLEDAFFLTKPLGLPAVQQEYAAATLAAHELLSSNLPSGKVSARLTYDALADRATSVTNGDGGTYQFGAPTTTGSTDYYRGALLSTRPTYGYPLDEDSGTVARDTLGQDPAADGSTDGVYSNVVLGTPGIFGDSGDSAGSFDGTSSYMSLPSGAMNDSNGSAAVGLWFRTTTAGGTLFSYQNGDIGTTLTANYVPALYIGSDGKLRGQFWDGVLKQMTSTAAVNDGKWHMALMTASGTTQTLYVDGVSQGTHSGSAITGKVSASGLTTVTIGAGFIGGNWPSPQSGNPQGYFNGQIAHVALYSLNPDQYTTGTAAYLYQAKGSSMSPMPTTSVTVTEPGSSTSVINMDPGNGFRTTSTVNSLGEVTRYTYDTRGNRVGITDADGHSQSAVFDTNGNAIQRTTCQTASSCQTSYYAYYWNASNIVDPRNGKVTYSADGRAGSTGTSNTAYRTAYTYTDTGALASVTTPPTAESPNGRTTTYTYTTSTTPALNSSVYAPAGLLASVTDPLGRTTSYKYYDASAAGRLGQVTEPSGQVTGYSYDRYGELIRSTVTNAEYPDGQSNWYTYDGQGRLATVLSPVTTDAVTGKQHSAYHTITYDVDGNILTDGVADWGQWTAQWITDPDNPDGLVLAPVATAGQTGLDPTRTTTYTYTAGNRIDSATDSLGHKTSYTYNGFGWTTGSTAPDGTVVKFDYDTVGQRTTTTLQGWTGDPASPVSPADLVLESRAYDPAGRLASVTDAMGRTTAYTYFDDARLQSVTSAAGTDQAVATSYTYDAAGNMITECDNWTSDNGCANQINYTYDAANRVTQTTTDPSGTNISLVRTLDAGDDVLTETRSEGTDTRATTYGYDTLGRLTSQSVSTGSTTLLSTTTYDDRGLVTARTDPRGNASGATAASYTTKYKYDEAGQLVAVTSPPLAVENVGGTANTTSVTALTGYDTFGDAVEAKTGGGRVQTDTYDAGGQLKSSAWNAYTAPNTGTSVTPVVQYDYDALGRLTTMTDPLGKTQTYGYDQLGNQTSTTLQDGRTSRVSYDTVGEQLSATDATGARTESTYDPRGQLITATQIVRGTTPAAYTTKFGYDPAGDLTSVTDPLGHTASTGYDHLGQPTSSTDGDGNTTGYAYNVAGGISQQTDPDGTATAYTYDKADRLSGVAYLNAAGTTLRTVGYGYDLAGNQTSVTDPLNKTITTSYDAANRITGQTQPGASGQSISTSFGYDADGNKTRYTDPNGNATTYTYNALGLQESTVVPAVAGQTAAADRTTTLSYDAGGRPTTTTRPGNVTLTSTYDDTGRLKAESGSGAEAATAARAYTYDGADRLLTATAGSTTEKYTYDDRGLLLTSSMSGWDTTFGYDAASRLVSQTDTDGTTTYGYDNAGQQTTQGDPITGTTVGVGYDKLGNPTTVSYGTGGATRDYTYDDLHQLKTDTLKGPSGTVEASVAYGYDNAGHLTSKTTAGVAGAGSNTYTYDDAGRLATWTAGSSTTQYGYDADGNRTRAGPVSYSYNARSELTQAGNTSYTYTSRGTTASATTGGKTTSVTSDAFDQQIADGSTGYTYDALGRLTGVTTGSSTQNLKYGDQSDNIVSDGTQNFGYTADGAALSVSTGGAGSFLDADRHGDVVGTFTATGNALTSSAGYDPYGNLTATSGSRADLGYQGGWTDPATGFVNTASRWYNPVNGDFTSADTQENDPSPAVNANPYAYGNDDPADNTDPSGHDPCTDLLKQEAKTKAEQDIPLIYTGWFDLLNKLSTTHGGSGGHGGTSGGNSRAANGSSTGSGAAPREYDDYTLGSQSSSSGSSGGGFWGKVGTGLAVLGAAGLSLLEWPEEFMDDPYLEQERISEERQGDYAAVAGSTTCTATNAPTKPKDKVKTRTAGPSAATGKAQDASLADPDLPPGVSSPFDAPDADNTGAQSRSQEITEEDGCVVLKLKRDGSPAKAIAWDCGGYAQVFDPNAGWDDPDHEEYQGPIPSDMGETPGSRLKNGGYHYVVNLDGSLRVVRDDELDMVRPYPGHTSLAEGRQVIAAGRLKVDAGEIKEISNFSGHYWPRSDEAFVSIGDIVHAVFERNGWPFDPGVWKEHP